MKYTIYKSCSAFDMSYAVKQNGEIIAEFWIRKHAIIFKKAMEKRFALKRNSAGKTK